MSDKWTSWMWNGAQDVYEAIRVHPFILGMADGTLLPERFAYLAAASIVFLDLPDALFLGHEAAAALLGISRDPAPPPSEPPRPASARPHPLRVPVHLRLGRHVRPPL